MLDKQYDPSKELYVRYENRVRRVVDAVAMLNVQTDELRECALLWAAGIKGQLYPQGDEQQMVWLKRTFSAVLSLEDGQMDEDGKNGVWNICWSAWQQGVIHRGR